ncbi:MAG TPA: RES family NAD+ phosphorylase [Candidatus Manganitrophaceae bacterium]|nr:RES family NAD+ phosphorylase [Candidatus Manganitrophaceae bacterium]
MADRPSSERLSERLRKIKPKGFQAKVYRILARHYQRQPLSLQGSLGLGGRYNPPYQFGALYCGLNEAVCWAEIEKKHEGPIRRDRFKLIPLHVRLTKVLDLTDLELLGRLQVAPEALTDPIDHSLTRRIAHEAREAGFEGIFWPPLRRGPEPYWRSLWIEWRPLQKSRSQLFAGPCDGVDG